MILGGFVPNSKKKKWTSPEIIEFGSPEEVWERYKARANPLELAALALLLERWRALDGEGNLPRKRRA